MYGLVNRALEGLIRKRGGDALWDRVRVDARVDVETFIRMDGYPDEVTYRLLASASKLLGEPQTELLEAFGEHWTLYTAEEGYGELLRAAGDTFEEFVSRLDELHARVGLIYPKLQPPRFKSISRPGGAIELHYHSPRPGLAPMVVGLLRGLGRRFGLEVEIEHAEDRARGADHDVFVVRTRPAA